MADASEMAAKLKRFAGHIELDENNHLGYDDAQCIRMAASLIERLTKPMTLTEAIKVLNKHKYDGSRQWAQSDDEDDELSVDEHNFIKDWTSCRILMKREAFLVARDLLSEKEAARG